VNANRQAWWALVAFLALALMVVTRAPAAAAAGSEPAGERSRPQGLGQLVVQDAQGGSATRLNISRYHVHVVLQPPVALVQIDQSFYNPLGSQQEGQFVFNLPPGASVSRFAMYVTRTQLIEGELIERQRAAQVYQTIVNWRRDPAILEQIGDNLFQIRVFPVPAHDEKRILLDFTLPLEAQADLYSFRLPLLSDLKPIWDFSITGVIRGPIRPDSAASPSHPQLAFSNAEDGAVGLEFRAQNYQPQTDLLLTFAPPVKPAATLRSYVADPLPASNEKGDAAATDEDAAQRSMYFSAQIPPPAGQIPQLPADVLVLIDTSRSVKDLDFTRGTVRQILEGLRPQDRVRLVCVDVAARPLHEGWLKAGPSARGKALRQLDREFALGGTELRACLHESLQAFDAPAEQRRRLVVCVGDAVDETTDASLIAAAKNDAQRLDEVQAVFIGIALPGAVPGLYVRTLAEASGGLWLDLGRDARAAQVLARWLETGLPAPERIVQADVEGAAAEDLYCPTAWVTHEPLYVYGRMPPAPQVKLTLKLGRGPAAVTRRWTLDVDRDRQDVFAGRLWAQRRLDQLRLQDPEKKENEDVRNRIIRLSQEWSLLSPFTAFLVLESEQDYRRWQIDRRVRHRYWKPPQARGDQPLPPSWTERAAAPVRGKEAGQQEEQTLEQAREALAAGDFGQVLALLRGWGKRPTGAASEEVTRLRRRAQDGIRSQNMPEALGLHRGLLDPASHADSWDLRPSILSLVGTSFQADPEFNRRHPHANSLLQVVDLSPLSGERPLEQFAAWLAERTGVNVALDQRALENMGIDGDSPVGIPWRSLHGPAPTGVSGDPFADPGVAQPGQPLAAADQKGRSPAPAMPAIPGRMSLRSAARHALKSLNLMLMEEPHRLLITTPEEFESRLTTEVYPVADLLNTSRVAPPWLLGNPYLGRDEAARRRIEAKLKRPLSVRYQNKPLADVVAELAAALDEPVLVDQRGLDDVGIGLERPVTASYRNVPALQLLPWILEQVDLVYTVRDEALVITSEEEAETERDVRLYSGRCLLAEHPVSPGPRDGAWDARGAPMGGHSGLGGGTGGFGMGGMGGMMGGSAMGGMGGGFFGGPGEPPPSGPLGLSSGGDGSAVAAESAAAARPNDGPQSPRSFPSINRRLQASHRRAVRIAQQRHATKSTRTACSIWLRARSNPRPGTAPAGREALTSFRTRSISSSRKPARYTSNWRLFSIVCGVCRGCFTTSPASGRRVCHLSAVCRRIWISTR